VEGPGQGRGCRRRSGAREPQRDHGDDQGRADRGPPGPAPVITRFELRNRPGV